MNVFHSVTERLKNAVASLGLNLPDAALARITIEPPREAGHGELASNAALVLAGPTGRPPRQLAEMLISELKKDEMIAEAEIGGPGFINLRMQPSFWQDFLKKLLRDPDNYGRSRLGAGRRVNVEYVSANPTGPMHVGHCRGAVVGDATASLLAFAGFDVVREYYINDAGVQVDTLAASAYLRYREALGEDITIPEGLYPGDYLIPVGEALKAAHGPLLLQLPREEWLPIVRATTIEMMMAMIRDDLAALHIRHDVFFSERSLNTPQEGGQSPIEAQIAALRARGLVYDGRLPPPKGQLPEDWEDREQTLFRASAYGDDSDRPLLKSDGSYTYFAADVAYMQDKITRGFDTLLFVLGADHGGYVKRLEALGEALSGGRVDVVVRLCQLVRLLRGGEPVKMSKRAGDFVTLREVVDEVGADAVRFIMLTRKNDASLDFDFVRVKEQSKDNPVFYVQYAHARCHSVFRQAEEVEAGLSQGDFMDADLSLLTDPGEGVLIRRLAEFPRLIEAAATAYEPHRLAFYLHDLASDLHAQWNRGKDEPGLRFVAADPALTRARLALIRAVAGVLARGLGLLGVHAPEEMR